jgi:hypothetical protein
MAFHLIPAGVSTWTAHRVLYVPPEETQCPFYKVDFENMAQTIELLSAMNFEHSRRVDAIVHLAAIPGPGMRKLVNSIPG